MELLGPEVAEAMAADVGERYGRSLAAGMGPAEGHRSVRAAMRVIADTLTAHGFAAHAEDQASGTAVVADRCPFGEAAASHPVLCAVDRGMVKGLLAGLCGGEGDEPTPVVLSSRARGDDTCAAIA
jgi:predicted ArsR family transcriptional regulator